MIKRETYRRIKNILRTLRYITTSLLLVELIVISGVVIAGALCN